jgi:membrane protein required for beta-lactamase induction
VAVGDARVRMVAFLWRPTLHKPVAALAIYTAIRTQYLVTSVSQGNIKRQISGVRRFFKVMEWNKIRLRGKKSKTLCQKLEIRPRNVSGELRGSFF